MANSDWVDKNRFLCPRYPYRGKFTPQTLMFNANLQEFAHRVEYVAGLHSNGKLSPAEAYREIKQVWEQLCKSRQLLGNDPPED